MKLYRALLTLLKNRYFGPKKDARIYRCRCGALKDSPWSVFHEPNEKITSGGSIIMCEGDHITIKLDPHFFDNDPMINNFKVACTNLLRDIKASKIPKAT